MAKFSQNTLNMIAGADGQILAENLIYNQKDYWNFAIIEGKKEHLFTNSSFIQLIEHT